jgi:hypothetical protein
VIVTNVSSITEREESKGKSKQHKCNFCSKSFSTKYKIERHHISHSNQRNFHCDICGKSFKCKDNFKKHILTHQTERNFEIFLPENFTFQKNFYLLVRTIFLFKRIFKTWLEKFCSAEHIIRLLSTILLVVSFLLFNAWL